MFGVWARSYSAVLDLLLKNYIQLNSKYFAQNWLQFDFWARSHCQKNRDALQVQWKPSSIILPLKCNSNNIILAKIWLGNNFFVSLQSRSITVVHPKRNPSQSWNHNWPIVKSDNDLAKSLTMIFARSTNFEAVVKTFPCREAIYRAGKYTPLNQSLTQVIYTMGRVEKYRRSSLFYQSIILDVLVQLISWQSSRRKSNFGLLRIPKVCSECVSIRPWKVTSFLRRERNILIRSNENLWISAKGNMAVVTVRLWENYFAVPFCALLLSIGLACRWHKKITCLVKFGWWYTDIYAATATPWEYLPL